MTTTTSIIHPRREVAALAALAAVVTSHSVTPRTVTQPSFVAIARRNAMPAKIGVARVVNVQLTTIMMTLETTYEHLREKKQSK